MKNNKYLNSISYFVFAIIKIFFIIGFIAQDRYKFIHFSEWFNILCLSGSYKFDLMLNLYFTIFVCLFGVYFTILAIFLSRNKVSFSSFFLHLFFLVLLPNFLVYVHWLILYLY